MAIAFVLALLGAAVACFVIELLPVDVVGLRIVVSLLLGRSLGFIPREALSVEDVLGGFANPALVVLGIGYMLLVGRRLLPVRRTVTSPLAGGPRSEYLTELRCCPSRARWGSGSATRGSGAGRTSRSCRPSWTTRSAGIHRTTTSCVRGTSTS